MACGHHCHKLGSGEECPDQPVPKITTKIVKLVEIACGKREVHDEVKAHRQHEIHGGCGERQTEIAIYRILPSKAGVQVQLVRDIWRSFLIPIGPLWSMSSWWKSRTWTWNMFKTEHQLWMRVSASQNLSSISWLQLFFWKECTSYIPGWACPLPWPWTVIMADMLDLWPAIYCIEEKLHYS